MCQLTSRQRGSDGLAVQPLTAWALPVGDAAPVRTLPSPMGRETFIALVWCASTSRHVGYGSWLERDRLIFLGRDPTIVGMASQPFRLDFELDAAGWGDQRVGALPRITGANLHWLAGYKRPRCLDTVDAHTITGLLHEGPLGLRNVVRAAGNPVMVLPHGWSEGKGIAP
ncbi:hypothetical protein CVV67_04685 [Arthrobacter stackebrandtii]|nr:hypothetical protein CVV67_04685 [Arthrobacter stackebrandtii]